MRLSAARRRRNDRAGTLQLQVATSTHSGPENLSGIKEYWPK
jgi:hypothetical protein